MRTDFNRKTGMNEKWAELKKTRYSSSFKLIFLLLFACLLASFLSLSVFSLPANDGRLAGSAYVSPIITLDKNFYYNGEIVNIISEIKENISDTFEISIISKRDVYKYLGTLEKDLYFTPKEPGEYKIEVTSLYTKQTIQTVNFSVVESNGSIYTFNKELQPEEPVLKRNAIYTNRLNYSVNERVFIYFSDADALKNNFILYVKSKNNIYSFVGEMDNPSLFVPKDIGDHELLLMNGSTVIARHSFYVSGSGAASEVSNTHQIQTERDADMQSQEIQDINAADFAEQFPEIKEKQFVEVKNFNIQKSNLKIINKDGKNLKTTLKVYAESVDEQEQIVYPENEKLVSGNYKVELLPDDKGINANIRKIEFFDVNYSGNFEIGLDKIEKERIKEIQKRKTVDIFAINPGNIDFGRGLISRTATGTELWKCKDWDFNNQQCPGQWVKIKNIYPGQEYTIEIDRFDPGYAETGVATVNSKKPIYHPGEKAELIMVVLDNAGYPVSNAEVVLTIFDPLNIKHVYSTQNRLITETGKGIYETEYGYTDYEGNYTLIVTATGDNVDSNLSSNFMVRQYYEFDILRDTPSTIDPYKGNYKSKAKIISYVDATSFNFTEAVPSNFEVVEASGAKKILAMDTIYLVWENLRNNSEISYVFKAPLTTPSLYSLFSFVEYAIDEGKKRFDEARAWFIAADPQGMNGIAVYKDTTNVGIVKYRLWNGSASTIQGEISGPNLGATDIAWQKITCLEKRPECILLTKQTNGNLYFAVYYEKNNSWSSTTFLSTTTGDWLQFDVECEDLSGDCLIVYENNTAADNQVYYRTYDASTGTLSASSNFSVTAATNSAFRFIKLYPQYNTNNIAIILQNEQAGGGETEAAIWTGSSFQNWQELYNDNPDIATRTVDCSWEGSSGELICFYGRDGSTGLWAWRWFSEGWFDDGQVWSGADLAVEALEITTCGETPFTGDLSHNKIIVITATAASRDGAFWNGTGLEWDVAPAKDTTTEKAIAPTSVCSWEHDGTNAVVAWVDRNSQTPEWGEFDGSTDNFTFVNWASGSVIGMPTWRNDVDSLKLALNPVSDQMLLTGHSLTTGAGDSSEVYCTRWTGSSFDATNCGLLETAGGTTTTGNTELFAFADIDWSRFNDLIAPNVTLIYPANETVSKINSYNFSWFAVDDWETTLFCNLTVDGILNQSAILSRNGTYTNYSVSGFSVGAHNWIVQCTDWYNIGYSGTFIFEVAGSPAITINSVGGDTSEPYWFNDETPIVNATLNINSTCYLGPLDENFTAMKNNGSRINCGYYERNNPKTCEYTDTLSIGIGNLYMACNSTFGDENNETNNKNIPIKVLCDAHTDCPTTQYCRDSNQECVDDEYTGYTCDGLGIGGLSVDEICRSGYTGANPTAKCVNDSSYYLTGWYCTNDEDDCVYDNGGFSYDLNYRLCNASSNDYKQCSADNLWGTYIDCAEQWTPYDQSATASTHSGYNCSYYAADQTCLSGDQDLGSFGCNGNPTDCGSYVYLQGTGCGSVAADCDYGCGAECDADNSTVPGIISTICYYDKSCLNTCLWQQSSETAPLFCINDDAGGICAYWNRTDPTSEETCYYTRTCIDVDGAGLSSSGTLKADYCDFCNATGNYTGQYAPEPNASCQLDCPNSGTIYYDSGLTPLDRSNDCNEGITTIFSDTLSLGDVWNGSTQAVCNNTECNNDCGESLNGTCQLGICDCQDNVNPLIELINPQSNAWTNEPRVIFYYNATDLGTGLENCSLLLNDVVTNTTNDFLDYGAILNFSRMLQNGTYNWSIECYDNSTNYNYNRSENRTIGIDTTVPKLSNPRISGTSFDVNDIICINITLSDTYSGINEVRANIIRPGIGAENFTLSDSDTASCDPSNGNNVYSMDYAVQYSGTYQWTLAFAFDNANNENYTDVNLNWNVVAGGFLNLSMISPSTNLRINESSSSRNYSFIQSCNVSCFFGGENCENVTLYAQYYNNSWAEITSETEGLVNLVDSYNCGDLATQKNATWWNTSYPYRKQIIIATTSGIPANYSVNLSFDTTGSKIQDDGDDVRIVYWNGTTNREINRTNETAWNTATTNIWFMLQKAITTTNYDYYIYYGNDTASNPPNNPAGVYLFYDNFESYSTGGSAAPNWRANTGTWTVESVSGNKVYRGYSTGYGTSYVNGTRFDNYSITMRYYVYNSSPSTGFNGLYTRTADMTSTWNTGATQGYLVFKRMQATNDIEIYRKGGGATSTLSTGWLGQRIWLNFRHDALGGNLKQFLNNTLFNNLNDGSPYYSGYISLAPGRETVDYDEVKIRKLISNEPAVSSGDEENISSLSYCQYNFTINTGIDSGMNNFSARCKATSTNSPTTYTGSINISINNAPYANLFYPSNGSWHSKTIVLNGSSSFDLDGNIVNYAFKIDDNAAFSSPTTICDTADSNCTFNTTIQDQCQNNSISCYLLLAVRDNEGLEDNITYVFGFDTRGPNVTIQEPVNFSNITSDFMLYATSADSETEADTVFFEYRENDVGGWTFICSDTGIPYNCSWDISLLDDKDSYQIRAYANDTMGNTGGYDVRYNITLDRNGPAVSLYSPQNKSWTSNYNITFYYNVSDLFSEIANCSLILNDEINSTNYTIVQNEINNFTVFDITEQNYTWSINCTDSLGNENKSQVYELYVDRTAPTAVLDRPFNFDNLSGATATVNATVTDSGIGVNATIFEYRNDSSSSWELICIDDNYPYSCSWDISSLIERGTYEVRVTANDSLGNTADYDVHTNIKLDKNGPKISLVSPASGQKDGDGYVQFIFSASDEVSELKNCTLMIDGHINGTMTSGVIENENMIFNLTNMSNGVYYWNITCFDDFIVPHSNTSETRTLIIDIRYTMNVDVTTSKNQYEIGNQVGEISNITTNTTDYYNNSIQTYVTLDIIYGNSSSPWWNISWNKRKPIFLSETDGRNRTNETIFANITGLASNISSCLDEIRIVDARTNGEIPVNITGGDDSTYCEIFFPASINANENSRLYYYAYYNNSGAQRHEYDWPDTLFGHPIVFDDFEEPSDFDFYNGTCPVSASYECIDSSPWDEFDNCIESEAAGNYGVCSVPLMNVTGLRGFMANAGLDRNTDNADGLYKYINSTPCEGFSCTMISLSYYQATYSMDAAAEGSAVYVNDTDGVIRLISDCMNLEACEAVGGTYNMSVVAEYVSTDLCGVSGISCTEPITVRFTSKNVRSHTSGDYFGWDRINITGYSRLSSGISASSGTVERWINRTYSQTSINGIMTYFWNISGNDFGNYSAISLATKNLYYDNWNSGQFEIVQDITPPNVTLNTPLNGSEANSTVTFTYIVDDALSTIRNCSLYIDDVFIADDPTIEESAVQYFYPRIPLGGWHNWSVRCKDYYNNTGISQEQEIYIRPPDITLESTDIRFSTTTPIEEQNITINATIYNIGGSDAFNVTVQFWDGNPDYGGTQINGNFSINLSAYGDSGWHTTLNVSWKVPGPGPHPIYVIIDPYDLIFELNESNNKPYSLINVPSWHTYYGNATGFIVLAVFENRSVFNWLANSSGNVFAAESGSIISWTELQALGRNISNMSAFNDFAEADEILNITNSTDSINISYTLNSSVRKTATFEIYDTNISYVPVINSTINDAFITGILWDYSDGGDEYDKTQDLIFITKLNKTQEGKYGIYDYEIRVPSNLKKYKTGSGLISFYTEIN